MRKHAPPIAAAAAVTTITLITVLAARYPAAAAEIALAPINFVAAIPTTVLGWIADLWQTITNAVGGLVQVYDAPGNAGVTVAGVGGYEWRGTPGLFVCDGQC